MLRLMFLLVIFVCSLAICNWRVNRECGEREHVMKVETVTALSAMLSLAPISYGTFLLGVSLPSQVIIHLLV